MVAMHATAFESVEIVDREGDIVDIAANLEVPEGFRVEAIEGKVIVTPPAEGLHALTLEDLSEALREAGARSKGLRVLQGIGLFLQPGRRGYSIPDLVLVDEDFHEHPLPYNCYPPSVFHLVVEVTSTNWREDLEIKVQVYARAGIEHFVIVDREHRSVLVLGRPHPDGYRSRTEYSSGEDAEIPGPVPCTVAVDDLLHVEAAES